MPYRTVPAAPITPAGMVLIAAPNFGTNASRIAMKPAIQYSAVEYTLVAAMTPMFSAYVVVPEPPPRPARVVARPSENSARPMTGLRSCPVIADTDFTCPMFSAMRTMTTGRNTAHTEGLIEGATNCGRPTQAALEIAE